MNYYLSVFTYFLRSIRNIRLDIIKYKCKKTREYKVFLIKYWPRLLLTVIENILVFLKRALHLLDPGLIEHTFKVKVTQNNRKALS